MSCVTACRKVYLSECSVWVWGECMFCCCWMKYSIDICWIQLSAGALQFFCVLADFFWCVCPLLRGEAQKSTNRIVNLPLSPCNLSDPASRVLTLLWDLSIKDCYFFLETWFLYHCPVSFILHYFTCSEPYFIWNGRGNSRFPLVLKWFNFLQLFAFDMSLYI